MVERTLAAGIEGVAGNYDSTVATDYKHCGCRSENARQKELAPISFEWTGTHTSLGATRILNGLRQVAGVHVVNTGSVGRSKDDDWRTGYVLLRVDATSAEFVRVPYDHDRTIAGRRAAGLPEDFGEFLRSGGRTPS